MLKKITALIVLSFFFLSCSPCLVAAGTSHKTTKNKSKVTCQIKLGKLAKINIKL